MFDFLWHNGIVRSPQVIELIPSKSFYLYEIRSINCLRLLQVRMIKTISNRIDQSHLHYVTVLSTLHTLLIIISIELLSNNSQFLVKPMAYGNKVSRWARSLTLSIDSFKLQNTGRKIGAYSIKYEKVGGDHFNNNRKTSAFNSKQGSELMGYWWLLNMLNILLHQIRPKLQSRDFHAMRFLAGIIWFSIRCIKSRMKMFQRERILG